MRDGDGEIAELLGEDPLHLLLVLGAHVGEEQADRHGLGPGLADRAAQGTHLALVDRLHDGPVGVEALVDAEAETAARHERLGLLPAEVVEHLAVDPLDVRHVLEALRRDERNPAPGALDQRVRADRRAVRERLDLARSDSALVERVDDRLAGVARRGRGLQRLDVTARGVEDDHVRERPARVDSDDEPH